MRAVRDHLRGLDPHLPWRNTTWQTIGLTLAQTVPCEVLRWGQRFSRGHGSGLADVLTSMTLIPQEDRGVNAA